MGFDLPVPGYDQFYVSIAFTNFPLRKWKQRLLPRLMKMKANGPFGYDYTHNTFRWLWLRVDFFEV